MLRPSVRLSRLFLNLSSLPATVERSFLMCVTLLLALMMCLILLWVPLGANEEMPVLTVVWTLLGETESLATASGFSAPASC